MDNSPVGLLTDQFAKLTDPRTGHAKRHKLIDVIVIAICAVICGADSWGGCRDVRQGQEGLVQPTA